MAAPKRSVFQREADLSEITSLYLQGKSQQEISETLAGMRNYSLSQQVISRDIQSVIKRWQKNEEDDLRVAKLKELAKIDLLEATYWKAWEKSLAPIEKQATEKKDGRYASMSAKLTKEDTCGDPRYLAGVQWCVEQRIKIFGLFAPAKLPVGATDMAGLATVHIYMPDNGRMQETT